MQRRLTTGRASVLSPTRAPPKLNTHGPRHLRPPHLSHYRLSFASGAVAAFLPSTVTRHPFRNSPARRHSVGPPASTAFLTTQPPHLHRGHAPTLSRQRDSHRAFSTMVGLTSAAGVVGFLSEPDPALRSFALHRLNEEIDLLWPEVAGSVSQM